MSKPPCAGFVWFRALMPWRWHQWRNIYYGVIWECAACGERMITGG